MKTNLILLVVLISLFERYRKENETRGLQTQLKCWNDTTAQKQGSTELLPFFITIILKTLNRVFRLFKVFPLENLVADHAKDSTKPPSRASSGVGCPARGGGGIVAEVVTSSTAHLHENNADCYPKSLLSKTGFSKPLRDVY